MVQNGEAPTISAELIRAVLAGAVEDYDAIFDLIEARMQRARRTASSRGRADLNEALTALVQLRSTFRPFYAFLIATAAATAADTGGK